MSNKSKIFSASAITALAALGLSSANIYAEPKMEKCYGVAKAKMNDCGTKTHSCAAQSKTNGSSSDWLLLPTGICDKLVNGSLNSDSASTSTNKNNKN